MSTDIQPPTKPIIKINVGNDQALQHAVADQATPITPLQAAWPLFQAFGQPVSVTAQTGLPRTEVTAMRASALPGEKVWTPNRTQTRPRKISSRICPVPAFKQWGLRADGTERRDGSASSCRKPGHGF